jgi:hypothetical protein
MQKLMLLSVISDGCRVDLSLLPMRFRRFTKIIAQTHENLALNILSGLQSELTWIWCRAI